MLAVAGMIGADARVPGMALMRAPLGQRGSLLPTGVNVAAGDRLDDLRAPRHRDRRRRALGRALRISRRSGCGRSSSAPARSSSRSSGRSASCGASSGGSPSGRSRSRSLYLTWWALDGADLGALWNADGEGGLCVWQGADVVVGITVSWIPYAADYTRFSTTRRGAFAGTGIGYFVPDAWLLALGAVLVLSRDLGDPAALPAAVVAGGFAAIVALFALLVTETDEAFANAYSAAVSLQNAFPRAPQALLIVLVIAIATAGALVLDFTSYQSFLLLLGSVFVPLFAVLLADWLAAGRHYTPDDVFESPAVASGPPRRVDRRVRPLPVALPDRPRLVGRPRRALDPPRLGHRRHRAELPRRVRPREPRRARSTRRDAAERPGVTGIAALGNLSARRRRRRRPAARRRCLLAHARARPPRRRRARRRRRAAPTIARRSCRRSRRSGSRSTWHESSTTTAYSFHYEGDRRIMWQDAVGTRGRPSRPSRPSATPNGSTSAR